MHVHDAIRLYFLLEHTADLDSCMSCYTAPYRSIKPSLGLSLTLFYFDNDKNPKVCNGFHRLHDKNHSQKNV